MHELAVLYYTTGQYQTAIDRLCWWRGHRSLTVQLACCTRRIFTEDWRWHW